MQQDIYFARRPSLDAITGVYQASSYFLLVGVALFSAIVLIAIVSIIRIIIHIRKAKREEVALQHEMANFYKKQLKLLHGKHFLHSLHQYVTLLVQLWKWKDNDDVRRTLGYDDESIQYMEKTIMAWEELDYEREKRIKDTLHQHIEQ